MDRRGESGHPTTIRAAPVTVGIPTYNRASFLRESISSVLAQSYTDFRLLIADNASEDETQAVVNSFDDPRIDYVRSETNIGLVPNQNRVMELAKSEYLLILPDDDLLYRDHLLRTVAILERNPTVAVVHTGFDLVDESSRVTERGRLLVKVDGEWQLEKGADFLERSMREPWTVCWPSALFRRKAMVEADGQRVVDGPMPDFTLLMRIARDWDFACLAETLAATRMHSGAATASHGSYSGSGYALDSQPRILYKHRLAFLQESALRPRSARRYRAVAEATFCRGALQVLANHAGSGEPRRTTSVLLAQLVSEHPRALLSSALWKLVAAELGGRRMRRLARGS